MSALCWQRKYLLEYPLNKQSFIVFFFLSTEIYFGKSALSSSLAEPLNLLLKIIVFRLKQTNFIHQARSIHQSKTT